MLDGEVTHQCWMGRRPTSAGWGGAPSVLDGEETHQSLYHTQIQYRLFYDIGWMNPGEHSLEMLAAWS